MIFVIFKNIDTIVLINQWLNLNIKTKNFDSLRM